MNYKYLNIYIKKEKKVLIFLEIHLIILVPLTQMQQLFIIRHFGISPFLQKIEKYY